MKGSPRIDRNGFLRLKDPSFLNRQIANI